MLYFTEKLKELPEGWYEHNRIAYIFPDYDVKVYRTENRGGNGFFGLIRYFVQIAGVDAPVPQSFFETLAKRFTIHYVEEYKYLDENLNTYYVYSSSGKYIKIMPQ